MFVSQPHQTNKMSEEDLRGASLSQPKKWSYLYIAVSENRGTPKSSILIRFSIINHPIWDTTIFGNTHIGTVCIVIVFFGGKP